MMGNLETIASRAFLADAIEDGNYIEWKNIPPDMQKEIIRVARRVIESLMKPTDKMINDTNWLAQPAHAYIDMLEQALKND